MNITGKTRVAGLFGYPVRHSLSPIFQNAAFKFLKLDCVYIPMEVNPARIGEAVRGIKALNFIGVNVTIPHKKAVLQHLDEIDEDAKLLGVVNTIVNKGGRLKGYTTDGRGFIRSLSDNGGGFLPAGKKVFILGAGGSSYAIAWALINEGVSFIYICNRTEEKSYLLERALSSKFGFGKTEVVSFENRNENKYWEDTALIVNTTSVGMKEGDPLLINGKNVEKVKMVYDLIYNRKTELLIEAERRGIPRIDGLSMLIYQGAISFELWTGKGAPVEVMKESLSSLLV